MGKTLSVIIPIYNSERFIPDIFLAIDDLRRQLQTKNVDLEVILVDDGSRDNSYALLHKHYLTHKDISIIKLTRNFGAIPALRSCLGHITGDAFLFLAADMQDPPDLIPAMVGRWLEGSKYVIARRKQRVDTVQANLFARVYYYLLRKLVVTNYPKHGFDLALMDRQFLPYLQQTGKHINIPLYPFWLGFEPDYIEYERRSIENKKSSWTFSKKFNLMVDSLLSFSRRPTRAVTLLGFFVSLGSFFYGLFIIISALLGQIEVPGFATIIALMSMFNGLIMLFLGITNEYLWRIFDEVNGHPGAVVDIHLPASDDHSVNG